MILTQADNGKPVALAIGESLSITLDSNPSTGYGWQLVPSKRAILQPHGEPEYTPPAQLLPGAGGQQTFQLVAIAAGRATLTLVYKRSFEPRAAPAQKFTAQVTIAANAASAGAAEEPANANLD